MPEKTYVLGVDSSTQSCKALLVEAETGRVVETRRAEHPGGTEVDPAAWRAALEEATADLLPRAAAVSVAGQQHGMVLLDERREPVRPALLWNDTRSAREAEELTERLGGPERAARRVGSVPVASYTATKLAWTRRNEPESARRARAVALPHDYLTLALNADDELVTDHGDASGTAYYSPADRAWVPEIAEEALGHAPRLPRLAEPGEAIGRTRGGAVLAAGTGDNMGAALGLGLRPGDVALSMGTSAVAMMVADSPAEDPSGSVSGFCDATGRYLPLACTLNGAPVMDLGRRLLGVGQEEFSELALAGEPGAGGAVFLPYLNGERTPNLPDATAQLGGVAGDLSRENLARAVVEGLACSVREAMDRVVGHSGGEAGRVLLIGGGARSRAFQRILAGILGRPLELPDAEEFVALGAARQAAWALSGDDEPPRWAAAEGETVEAPARPEVFEAYLRFRETMHPGA